MTFNSFVFIRVFFVVHKIGTVDIFVKFLTISNGYKLNKFYHKFTFSWSFEIKLMFLITASNLFKRYKNANIVYYVTTRFSCRYLMFILSQSQLDAKEMQQYYRGWEAGGRMYFYYSFFRKQINLGNLIIPQFTDLSA